jgi:hypothetical protein
MSINENLIKSAATKDPLLPGLMVRFQLGSEAGCAGMSFIR